MSVEIFINILMLMLYCVLYDSLVNKTLYSSKHLNPSQLNIFCLKFQPIFLRFLYNLFLSNLFTLQSLLCSFEPSYPGLTNIIGAFFVWCTLYNIVYLTYDFFLFFYISLDITVFLWQRVAHQKLHFITRFLTLFVCDINLVLTDMVLIPILYF